MSEQEEGQEEVVNAKSVPHIPRQEGERGTAGQGRKQQDTGLENKRTNKSHLISHFVHLKCGFSVVSWEVSTLVPLGEAGESLPTHILPRNYPSFGIPSLDMTTGPKAPGGDRLAWQLRCPESHPFYFLRKPCLKSPAWKFSGHAQQSSSTSLSPEKKCQAFTANPSTGLWAGVQQPSLADCCS